MLESIQLEFEEAFDESAETTVLGTRSDLLGAVLSLGDSRLAYRLVCRCWAQELTNTVAAVALREGNRAEEVVQTFPNLIALRYAVLDTNLSCLYVSDGGGAATACVAIKFVLRVVRPSAHCYP